MRLAFPAFLLTACAGGHADAPPPSPAPEATTVAAPGDDPYAACIAERCKGADDAPSCAQERCPHEDEQWRLEPRQVGYDGNVLSVAVKVHHTSETLAGKALPRTREAYVGVTAIRDDGEEIDLAIHTLFPGRFEDEPLIVSEVGEGVRDIIFGLWDRKVEPCDSSRSGCRKFGFLLDGSLAAWPPRIYVDGQRQRILPDAVNVRVSWAGHADPASALSKLRAELDRFAEPFGAKVTVGAPVVADAGAADVRIVHRDAHDAPLAAELAALVGGGVAYDKDADVDLHVVLGGEADRFTCGRDACTDADDLTSCLASSCP